MRLLGDSVNVPPIRLVLSWAENYRGPEHVIDASQGTSGAVPPQPATGLPPRLNEYGDRQGSVSLRAAIAHDLRVEYPGADVRIDDILVTAGCNEAFCATLSATVESGDRVAMLSPFYFNHDMWFKLNRIQPRYVPVRSDGTIDPGAMHALTSPIAAVCGVSPSNPTGVELAPQTIEDIATLCKQRGVPFILDETYASFRKDRARSAHDVFRDPQWRDYFVSLRSFSKEYSIPGHRIGAAVASPALLKAASKWHDCISIVAPSPGQQFAEHALANLTEWRRFLADDIRSKGELFASRIADADCSFRLESWGAFFAWMHHPFAGCSDVEAARKLASDHGLLTVPGSFFSYADTGRLRLSFAALDGCVLDAVVERLKGASQ